MKGVFRKDVEVKIVATVEDVYNDLFRRQGYPDILKDEALALIREVYGRGGRFSPSRRAVATVALYVAAERLACPIDSRLIRWAVGGSYRRLLRKFREISPRKEIDYYLQCAFRKFMNKIMEKEEVAVKLSEPGVSSKIYEEVFLILSLLPAGWVIARNPVSVMSGVCYIVFNMEGIRITQRDLCEIFMVTETTVRNNYHKILKLLAQNEQVPAHLKDKLFYLFP